MMVVPLQTTFNLVLLNLVAATGPAVASRTTTGATAIRSTVYTHGENNFPCIRIPSTLALPSGVMLSFAAARSWTGDVRAGWLQRALFLGRRPCLLCCCPR
jgi:hypothetical protein